MLSDVNTTDIEAAIRLGCRTMCSVFNADDQDIPFFSSQVWPEAKLSFSQMHSESHVPGRHLNALLNAENALGHYVDEGCIARHARAAFLSYSGELPLPLNRDRVGGRLWHFSPHNIREGFHALYALARFRSSARALKLAESSIRAIGEHWHPRTGWDTNALQGKVEFHPSTFIAGLARAIGPLVKLHRYTGCAGALDLAMDLRPQGHRRILSAERQLRSRNIRHAYALDHLRALLIGAIGRTDPRRAADGAGTCIL